jgi:hypothetical protein
MGVEMRFLKKSRNLKRTYSSFSELSKYFLGKESRLVLWSRTGRVRACMPESLPSPKRFVQAGVTARRRGFLLPG